jgi:enoyl-[acyl-carrier protein] reductase I
VSIDDVGFTTAFLCTDYARMITGNVVYVDGGYNIVA